MSRWIETAALLRDPQFLLPRTSAHAFEEMEMPKNGRCDEKSSKSYGERPSVLEQCAEQMEAETFSKRLSYDSVEMKQYLFEIKE